MGSQSDSRLSQRPQGKKQGNFSSVSLSRSELDKVSLGRLEPVPQRSQSWCFWGMNSSSGLWFSDLDSRVWGIFCQHWLNSLRTLAPPPTQKVYRMLYLLIKLFGMSHQLMQDLLVLAIVSVFFLYYYLYFSSLILSFYIWPPGTLIPAGMSQNTVI